MITIADNWGLSLPGDRAAHAPGKGTGSQVEASCLSIPPFISVSGLAPPRHKDARMEGGGGVLQKFPAYGDPEEGSATLGTSVAAVSAPGSATLAGLLTHTAA